MVLLEFLINNKNVKSLSSSWHLYIHIYLDWGLAESRYIIDLNCIQLQGDAEIEKQPDCGPLNYWGKVINSFDLHVASYTKPGLEFADQSIRKLLDFVGPS